MSRSHSSKGYQGEMEETLQFVIEHGYVLLFGWVLVEQLGLPLPAIPILLSAGALAGRGELNGAAVLGVTMTAALMSDITWYHLGRRRGMSILRMLCRISLEPDSCVRRTENVFARQGERTLLFAKFVPGLNTATPSMAGTFGMPLARFVVFDALGVLFWAGGWLGLGFLLRSQLESVAAFAAGFGAWTVTLVALSLAGFLGWKYWQRIRVLRHLRVSRVTPEEVKDMLDDGRDVAIVDLRHAVEFASDPVTLPGAIQMPVEEFDARHGEIPRGKEIILYCS